MSKKLKLILDYFCYSFVFLFLGSVSILTTIAVYNESQESFCDFAVGKGFYENTTEERFQCVCDYSNYLLELIKGGLE